MIRLILATFAALSLLLLAGCQSSPPPTPSNSTIASKTPMTIEDEDFLWLEAVEDEEALDWVRAQNDRSLEHLQEHPLFDDLQARALEVLTSQDRIAWPELRGEEIYNFWRDGDHERGIWRITSRESFRSEEPDWEILLDVDALADEEDKNWVWAGAHCRYPDYERCFVELSIGGADATVIREFDLTTRQFVEDGYTLEESKSYLSWLGPNRAFYGPAFTEEHLTTSGYPRNVYIWERGTSPDDASLVYTGEKEDVLSAGMRLWDGQTPYDLIFRMVTFYRYEYYLMRDGETHRVEIPADAQLHAVVDGKFLVELKSEWAHEGQTFAQGSLLATPVEAMIAGTPDFEIVFTPNERQSVHGISTTQNTVLVGILDNVRGSLLRFTHGPDGWEQSTLDVPQMGTIRVITTDDLSDDFFYQYTGFLNPTGLYEADAVADTHGLLRSEPAWFDASSMQVQQHFARSADGTEIPYFLVTPPGFEADGTNPTLLSGYGGFEIARTPYYSGVLGSSWLERGGVFVVANIRGGGEFGPSWHQAALLENRQRSFDDFIAVAEDLVERNITSASHLGIMGGSNGGLLVGAAMVQRPDLFNAVVCQVPLLDMRRYHLLLAGASWMAEYGDPDNPEHWEFIRQYSPFQNVKADVEYPQAFFTTSTRDDRVHPGHARKMVAKMDAQGHRVLYYENIEGGHGGAANQRQRAFISALTYAYLHDRLSGL